MENLTKPTTLSEIHYPVFKIGKEIPAFEEGVSFFCKQYKLDFGDIRTELLIIDDKNIKEPTLAKRRLRLMTDGVKLKKLGKAVFFLGDLIKLSDRQSWFIDSFGNVFQYKKSKFVKLIFRPIVKIIALRTGGAVIEVLGISTRFKTTYTPKDEEVYAGILQDSMSNILYGVYNKKYEDTRRMI